MNRYRVIQYANGRYGIQRKKWFFGLWENMPFHTDFLNGAKSQIDELKAKDEESVVTRKGLKVVKVIK